MLGAKAGEIGRHAAIRFPDHPERHARDAALHRWIAVGGDEAGLVVPEQTAHVPFALEAHHQIERAHPVRAAVDEIADEPESPVAARPGNPLVDKTRVATQPDERLYL